MEGGEKAGSQVAQADLERAMELGKILSICSSCLCLSSAAFVGMGHEAQHYSSARFRQACLAFLKLFFLFDTEALCQMPLLK